VISVDAALAQVFALAPAPVSESVPLRAAAHRVLLGEARAGRDQPPFAASAMDGYAIAAETALPGASFRVIGTAAAGAAHAGRVGAGEAVRIFTGAPVPEGATRVVIQENVTATDDRIILGPDAGGQTNIRPAGADFRAGDTLSGPRRLRAVDLARLAAMNLAEVTVARRPEVALIATGDELVMPGEMPRDDQIVASNAFALAAMVEEAGGGARMLPIARDTDWSLRAAFTAASDADVIVTIGGASVGDHDLVGPVAREMGLDLAFHRIAMRPGKPLMAGRMGTSVMLGLPGNPVSAIVCARLFLLPLLDAMQGLPARPAPRRQASLTAPLAPNGPREHYMRAVVDAQGIRAFDRQDSSLLSVLSEANALLVRPIGDVPRAAGEIVDYLPL
jgi:molybdopterin molybdotransferase